MCMLVFQDGLEISSAKWIDYKTFLRLIIYCTLGPVSTEMGDQVRVQFPVPDIYFGM